MTSAKAPAGRVLLVEDEDTARDLHDAVLVGAGFETATAATLAELRDRIARARFDVVLLDLRLPDGNALDLIAELRGTTSAGIIIATSSRDQQDRLTGLENGADDYLQKPVHPRELLARIRNLMTRLRTTGAPPADGAVFRFEGWTAELGARRVTFSDGGEAHLTEHELLLLQLLIRNIGRPVHRDRLTSALGEHDDMATRAVDKTVYRLRLKLHAVLGSAAPLIETVHGFGYRFTAKPL